MQAAYWKPGDSEPLARFDDEVVCHALELARLGSDDDLARRRQVPAHRLFETGRKRSSKRDLKHQGGPRLAWAATLAKGSRSLNSLTGNWPLRKSRPRSWLCQRKSRSRIWLCWRRSPRRRGPRRRKSRQRKSGSRNHLAGRRPSARSPQQRAHPSRTRRTKATHYTAPRMEGGRPRHELDHERWCSIVRGRFQPRASPYQMLCLHVLPR